MRIKTIEIKNFRLIEEERLILEEEITLIVGKNNSGKTSFVDIFYVFLEKTNSKGFQLVDFSCGTHSKFKDAHTCYLDYVQSKKNKEEEKIQEKKRILIDNKIPKIELNILVEYNKGTAPNYQGDRLGNLSEFITDLDDDKNTAWICIEYSCDDTVKLFEGYELKKKKDNIELIDYLGENISSKYSIKYYAGKKDAEIYRRRIPEKEGPLAKISNIFLTRTVSAQRYIFNKSSNPDNTSNPNSLSGGFSKYYENTNKDNNTVDDIKKSLSLIERELGAKYNELFQPILKGLKGFGAETPTKIPDVEIQSKFNTEGVLRRNIKYYYQKDGVLLPEKNNGLGYNNLIYMILQFASFFEEFKNKNPQSNFLLLFIEEPEAYMHPQMQQLFIRHIKNYIDKNNVKAQIVITTHASHIVAESGIDEKKGFDRIRYFDISKGKLQIKDFSKLEMNGEDKIQKLKKQKFLKQYLATQKCDLFFADYVIMVEGVSERVLMPFMIEKVVPDLNNKYISIMEVGGAYAYKFKELLEFINVPTLILTDIDSIDKENDRKACKVTEKDSHETCNQTIINFLNKRKIAELLKLKEEEKIRNNIKISYQIKENADLNCGRSFEESFILKNAKILCNSKDLNASKAFFDKMEKREILNNSYDNTSALLKKVSKTDFAFDIMLLEEWKTPLYIENGIKWLSKQ